MAFVKLTDEELRKRMQEVIDNVADNLKKEAVNTICAEGTTPPKSAEILISIGIDMIPTITYTKDVYVIPLRVVPSERFEHESKED